MSIDPYTGQPMTEPKTDTVSRSEFNAACERIAMLENAARMAPARNVLAADIVEFLSKLGYVPPVPPIPTGTIDPTTPAR